eukprot:TRINITY_DN7420_c0_g2_i1.p3 TRINITY_DN7420_c0_g2~~TRINITY_DN7420_c0_g2_i1.p3  ORF type:complete len:130 (+),score=11.43 TRINITY_DN7420_c0_g2_i1:769-1158(+)
MVLSISKITARGQNRSIHTSLAGEIIKSFVWYYGEIYNISQCECIIMVKVPCQEIVWDIIPAIQAALAAELVNLGVSQIQVAKSLSLAPSAVSQYLSGKRGYRIVFDDEIKDVIAKIAEEIKSGPCTLR